MSVLTRRPLAREALLSAVVGAALAGLLIWLGPPGVDLAAHSYQRTFLLQHGFALWNNFWYAGRYSFVTYSFIYYPLAAVLGITVLAIASIATAALAFTLVVWHEWGERARLSSRAFAVLWTGIVLSAAFPFALGMALALLSVSALQHGRRRLFALLLFATLLASPVAFLLLVLVLAGGALERPPRRATVAVIGVAVAFELALRRVFPGQGHFPFSLADLVPGLLFGALGMAVTARGAGAARPLRPFPRFPGGADRRLRRPERPRLERGAPEVRSDPARPARSDHCSKTHHACRAARGGCRVLEHLGARTHRPYRRSRPGPPPRLLAAGDPLPARAPEPVVPRRGRRHGRALARGLPARRGHPDRARLVPAERLPAERAPVRRGDRRPRLPGLAAHPRRSLRGDHRRAARLQRPRRGAPDPLGPLGSRPRLPQPARDGLRAAGREPDRHRALRRDRPLDVADAHRLLGRQAGALPRQGALVAVLAHLSGLRLARLRRHRARPGAQRRPHRSPRQRQRLERPRDARRADAAPHVRRPARLSAVPSSGHGRGNDLISRGAARRARGPARLGPRVPLTRFHSRRGSPSSKRS